MRTSATILLTLAPCLCAAQTQLVINELCNCNVDQWVDASYNYGSWVELYNPTAADIDITGWYVSDDADMPCQVRITQPTVVPAQGYQVLSFGHYDALYSNKTLDMKLDADGGTLCLADSRGQIVGQLDYPEGISRCSWARQSDGTGEWGYCLNPTPARSNQKGVFALERLSAPEVSRESGFFSSGTQTLTVSIPEGCTLRYTTDGSAPTLTTGNTSTTGTFTTTSTRLYRFRLFRDGFLPSPVVTRTLIKSSYDIDVPIVSVTGTYRNFYSDSLGIFVRGCNGRPGLGQSTACNWNMDWERPAAVTFFSPSGTVLASQEMSVERFGGWSRAWQPWSFRLKASKQYEGHGSMPDYPFFAAKPYLKHKVLLLRNGGNDNVCRIKDAALQQIVATSGIDIDYQEYQPVAHFVNGSWLGLLNMREANNKHFVYANYGLDDDEIDQFEMTADSGYVQKCGTDEALRQLLTLSKSTADDDAYQRLCQLIDMDEYCNYMAIEFYLCNSDWPQNNVKGWRERTDDGRWRFVLFDLDGMDWTSSPFTTFASKQTYTFDQLYGAPVSRITKEIEVVTLFSNLLNNATFRKKFIDTFSLVASSVFEPERCRQIITTLAQRAAHTQALYGNGSPWGTANDLINALSSSRQTRLMNLLRSYGAMRLSGRLACTATIQADAAGARLTFNGMTIPTGRFDGKYYAPAQVTAYAPAGYVFVGWKQASADGEIVSTEATYTLPTSGSTSIVAAFEPASQHQQAGAVAPVVINELSADNGIYVNDYQKKADWIELYNTTDQDIDLEGMYITDNLSKPDKCRITADGALRVSTLLPARGYRIIWCDKEAQQTELHASFKLANAADQAVMITAADGTWSDTLAYGVHGSRETVGRCPDGSRDVWLLNRTTPAKANALSSYARRSDTTAAAIDAVVNDRPSDDRYVVYDVRGTLLVTGNGPVSLSDLPAGIYIVKTHGLVYKVSR